MIENFTFDYINDEIPVYMNKILEEEHLKRLKNKSEDFLNFKVF